MPPARPVRIPLHARDGSIRAHALIDIADFPRVAPYRWSLAGHGYVHRRCGPTMVYLHRELLGLSVGDGMLADHRNGDPLDNRRANLRVTDRAGNNQNTRPRGGSSRFRGVAWHTGIERWVAYGSLDGRKRHLGSFATEEEAAAEAAAWRAANMPMSAEAAA